MEKMLEMARQGYWKADAKTVAELKERYKELAKRHDVQTDNKAFKNFVAPGFGLAAMQPAASAPTRPQSAADLVSPPAAAPPPPAIQGMLLEKVDNTPPPTPPLALFGGTLVLLTTLAGGLATARRQQRARA